MEQVQYRSGEIAQVSGIYGLIDEQGQPTGFERTVVAGEPFPPTPRPDMSYQLNERAKHRSDLEGSNPLS